MEDKIVVRPSPRGSAKNKRWISERELEVVQAIQEGKNNKEIAVQLGITEVTVKTHRHKILKRLGCRKTSELLTLLFRDEVIS